MEKWVGRLTGFSVQEGFIMKVGTIVISVSIMENQKSDIIFAKRGCFGQEHGNYTF